MKTTALGLREYRRNVPLNIFLALQIAVVFTALNIIIGFYNNVTMLYNPYEAVLSDKGFYMSFDIDSYMAENADEVLSAEEFTGKDMQKIADKETDKMKGNKTVVKKYKYIGNQNFNVDILDDDIFNGLRLPLESGKYKKGCAVVSFNSGYKVGDKIELPNGEVEVSGVLTSVSYEPSWNSYEYRQTEKDFYSNYDAGTNATEFAIMNYSDACKYIDENELDTDSFFFVTFDNISDEDYEYNKSIAEGSFICQETQDINANALNDISERYKKYVPILMIITLAAFIGIISYSVVSVLKSKRSNEIYYNCGSTSLQCFGVTVIKGIIVFLSAVIISLIAYTVMTNMGIPQKIGVKILGNNAIYTLLMTAVMLVVYSVISFTVFSKFRRRTK